MVDGHCIPFVSRDTTVLKLRFGVATAGVPPGLGIRLKLRKLMIPGKDSIWTTCNCKNFWTYECTLKFHVLLEYKDRKSISIFSLSRMLYQYLKLAFPSIQSNHSSNVSSLLEDSSNASSKSLYNTLDRIVQCIEPS